MDTSYYLQKFQEAVKQLDHKLLAENSIDVAVGVYIDSVFIKFYKKSWSSDSQNPLTAESRIFFSLWVNDSTIEKQQISYNIHALKLRKLKGYKIQSRKFAEIFRDAFQNFIPKWKNVSTNYGPLTLMEGWIKLDLENFENELLLITENFLEIEFLIDTTLKQFKIENNKL
ncbi:hypothetical protein [Flavobacterium mesophilum]|uniref:hypothetical protein n=1 Tax=Flavobacterium mesophilum TaxID=3143495 RepID=UPI0031E3C932